MHECLNKTFSQNCLHGEIAFSNSTCIYFVIMQGKKGRQKNYYGGMMYYDFI